LKIFMDVIRLERYNSHFYTTILAQFKCPKYNVR
jgi:hypothetical protein